jgi:hypothetical protein
MTTKTTVDAWLLKLAPTLQAIAGTLRTLILEADSSLGEAIKWGNPTYEKNGRVCYLAAYKGYITLGFYNGASLTDPAGIVEGTGKKMRHIKVS